MLAPFTNSKQNIIIYLVDIGLERERLFKRAQVLGVQAVALRDMIWESLNFSRNSRWHWPHRVDMRFKQDSKCRD